MNNLTTPSAVRKMLKAFREDGVDWKDWIQLRIADRKGNTKKADYHRFQIKDIVLAIHKELKPASAPAVLSIKDLAVRGDDVMKALGLKSGPEVGRILKALMEFVLDNPESNTRDQLLQLVSNLIVENRKRSV